jgi:hypothetical protein
MICPSMSLLSRVPLVALLAALAVFTLSLFLAVTSGKAMAEPINLLLVLLLAMSVALLFLAQNPNNENAALMLWFGAGVWAAAAYLNFQLLGLADLFIAALSAIGAFWVERESRRYSFAGPALCIGIALLLVILSNFLARP